MSRRGVSAPATWRVEGWDIWCAADGRRGAVELGSERPPELTPAKVAVVIADAASSKISTWSRRWRDGASFSPATAFAGREADGVDAAFLAAATQKVYFPLRGFTSSLNLSVATARLSRVFDWYPHFVGDLDENELRDLREEWRPRIAPTPPRAHNWGLARRAGDPARRRGRRRGGRLLRVVGAAEDPGGRAARRPRARASLLFWFDPDVARLIPACLVRGQKARLPRERHPFAARGVFKTHKKAPRRCRPQKLKN